MNNLLSGLTPVDPSSAARKAILGSDFGRNALADMSGDTRNNPLPEGTYNALAMFGGPTQAAANAVGSTPQASPGAATETDFLRYANQNATRSLPLSERLTSALSFLPELGVEVEVFSGGQPAAGEGPRVGSTRHDHGDAADAFFYKDGRRLDWSNPDDVPLFKEIVRRGRSAGLTGFGAGDGYMQPGSMHIGFGNEAVWGAGGSSSNAPRWLREAYGSSSPFIPGQETRQAQAQPSQQAPSGQFGMDSLYSILGI